MLRYYDETGLLKPAQTDSFTNYRLYSAEQIPVLNKIVFLRDLGFGSSDIAAALNHWDYSYIKKQLDKKQIEIEHTIKAEQDRLLKLQLAKADILNEKIAINYNVSIKSIPGCQVLSLRRRVPDYYSEGILWKELSAFAEENKVIISDHTFSIYHDAEYREQDVDIEICTMVTHPRESKDGFTYRYAESVPIMASTMVYGSFEKIGGVYLAFAGWLQKHNQYRMGTHSRQIVHRGSWNEENIENYLTEIQIPLEHV